MVPFYHNTIRIMPFIACWGPFPALSQLYGNETLFPRSTAMLTDEQETYPLEHFGAILEDPTTELTIDDIMSPKHHAQYRPVANS